MGNDIADFFDTLQINVFLYLAENDVHYYLCNYFACDPWNYPSNNVVLATVSQELSIPGDPDHISNKIHILSFDEGIAATVTLTLAPVSVEHSRVCSGKAPRAGGCSEGAPASWDSEPHAADA